MDRSTTGGKSDAGTAPETEVEISTPSSEI